MFPVVGSESESLGQVNVLIFQSMVTGFVRARPKWWQTISQCNLSFLMICMKESWTYFYHGMIQCSLCLILTLRHQVRWMFWFSILVTLFSCSWPKWYQLSQCDLSLNRNQPESMFLVIAVDDVGLMSDLECFYFWIHGHMVFMFLVPDQIHCLCHNVI